jgi:predicted lipoprotein with Yx(FWY)xxD motif
MRTRLGAISAALFVFTLAACSGGSTGSAGSSGNGAPAPAAAGQAGGQAGGQAANSQPVAVGATQSALGTILTDTEGRTLYAFTNDKGGTSSCAGQCIATWPALAGVSAPKAAGGIDASLLGTTARAEGTMQATYNKWPLYYYAGDVAKGDTGGQGVNGVWFVVNAADGTLIRS